MGDAAGRNGGLGRLARTVGAALGALRRPDPGAAHLAALSGLGAHYAAYSAHDDEGIGIDLDRMTLMLATRAPDGEVAVALHPLGAVRSATWTRVDPADSNTYGIGPAAFAGAVQATAMGATARRQALDRSGLSIDVEGAPGSPFRICLDGDAERLALWAERVERARDGTLAMPETPVQG